MSKFGLSGLLLAAIGLYACNDAGNRGGGLESDGQSHWLQACQSSSECGDAQCLCGVCSRGCSAPSECGAGYCVEAAALGAACGAPSAPARICFASNPLPNGADAAAPSMADASVVDVPRAGANSVGMPDGGSAGSPALDAAVIAVDAAIPFDRAVCDEYDSDATPSPTMVRLVNGTTATIYLGPTQMNCGPDHRFTLETAEGVPVWGHGGNCVFTCKQLQMGQCGCLPVCDFTAVIALMPGEHFETEWQGTQFATEVMPDGCYPAESCQVGASCFVERTIEETLTVKANAYPEVSCGDGVTCMPCMQNGGGNCVVFDGRIVRGTPRGATATWTPGQATVTLTF